MRLKRREKKISQMVSWMFSYMFVFFIPMVVGLFLYSSTEKIIRDDINTSRNYVISQIQLNFDNITSSVYALSNQIAGDSDINKLLAKENFAAEDRLIIRSAISKCSLYKASNVLVDDFFVYMKNSGSILRYSSFVEGNDINKIIPFDTRFGEEVWHSIINGEYNNKIIPYSYYVGTGVFRDCVSYVIPIPNNLTDCDGFLIANINKKRYSDVATEVYPNSVCMVLDGSGRVVFSNSDDLDEESISAAVAKSKNGLFKMNGDVYFINELSSNVNNLKYISITAKDTAFKRLFKSRRTMYAGYILCILIGILFSFYFTKRHYKPMKEIVELMIKHKLMKTGNSEDDMLLIDAVSRLVSDKNDMERRLMKQYDYVAGSTLSMLINGRFYGETTPEKLESMCGLKFDERHFSVLAIHIYEDECETANDIGEYELKFFIIKNIFEELLGRYFYAYIAEINSVICAVLNFSEDGLSDYVKNIEKLTDFGKSAVFSNFNIEIAIASSSIKRDINSLPECYNEAVLAINSLIFKQSKELVFYDGLLDKSRNNYEYFFSLGLEQRLINVIKSGNAEKAKEVLNEIFEKNRDVNIDTVEIMKFIIMDVSAALFKAAAQIPVEKKSDILKELINIQQYDAKTINDRLPELVERICLNVEKSTIDNRNGIIDEIKKLIEFEYGNMELNVSYIADKLKMNANYISRIFSENMGEGLLNYITNYRVEKSKTLLRNSDMSIENIARIVGFASTNTYMRVFKKNELVTPGQYRRMD